MTPPTTRAEYENGLTALIREAMRTPSILAEHPPEVWLAKRILAWQDTFATVCPREPTEAELEAVHDEICNTGGMIPTEGHCRDVIKGAHAASPFAPEKTDG